MNFSVLKNSGKSVYIFVLVLNVILLIFEIGRNYLLILPTL